MATATQPTQKIEVTSAPTVAPVLTEEQRKLRYAELRERFGKSRTSVIAPAGMHPYWARKEDEEELARLDALGFVIVKEVTGQPKKYKAAGLKEDGTYQQGDVILLAISTEEWDFYEGENLARANSLVPSAKDSFRANAEAAGLATFDQTDKKSTR